MPKLRFILTWVGDCIGSVRLLWEVEMSPGLEVFRTLLLRELCRWRVDCRTTEAREFWRKMAGVSAWKMSDDSLSSSWGPSGESSLGAPVDTVTGKQLSKWVHVYGHIIPYSRKLSSEKTFVNFVALWVFAQVFCVKFGSMAAFGAAKVSNQWKFSQWKSYFSPIFLPRKFPAIRYKNISSW